MKTFLMLFIVSLLTACSSAPKKTEMDKQIDNLERLSTIAKSLQPATPAPIIINNPPAPPAPVFNNVTTVPQQYAPPSQVIAQAAPQPQVFYPVSAPVVVPANAKEIPFLNYQTPPGLIPGSEEDQKLRANFRRSHYDMLRPPPRSTD